MNNSMKKETPSKEISLAPSKANGGEIVKFDAESLIARAIDQKVPVETMEKLLAMRRELKAEWAKEQFDRAMANFQRECPIIEKETLVDFTSKRTGSRTKYNYAKLDEIVRQVKNLIAKHGLSYTIETENTETSIVSIVKVRHIDGHSETTRFEVPIDKDSYMSAQQQYGAASTFGKRYAFCNAFGILTGDEDTDAKDNNGNQKSPESMTYPQEKLIKDLMAQKGIQKLGDIGILPPAHLTKSWADQTIVILLAQKPKSKIEQETTELDKELEEIGNSIP